MSLGERASCPRSDYWRVESRVFAFFFPEIADRCRTRLRRRRRRVSGIKHWRREHESRGCFSGRTRRCSNAMSVPARIDGLLWNDCLSNRSMNVWQAFAFVL